MASKFSKGALVWVKHKTEAWQPATVSEVLPKGRVRVFFGNGSEDTLLIKDDHPLLRTIPCEGDIEFGRAGEEAGENDDDLFTDDLTKMTQLITPAVLHTLRKSYNQGRFYSKLGSGTVLALNPFKDVPTLFTLKTIQSYHSVSLSELQRLPAHVYAAAQGALVTLRASVGRVNQSIIVSGESGAGKTWTVRCLMRYLAEVGIEYKRRLSSADVSETPLKGFHVSPIRARIKETVYEHQHHDHDQFLDERYENGLEDSDQTVEYLDCSSDAAFLNDNEPDLSKPARQTDENANFNNNKKENLTELLSQSRTSDDVTVANGNQLPTALPKILNFDEVDVLNNNPKLDESDDFEDCVDVVEGDVDDLNTSVQVVDRIERRILFSNPILEAFGNAHTLRNENSSRFGKYIQLQYDRSGTIVGAQLRTYLLEKTRAVRHDPGERSYHIFYQMLHGASPKERNEWKLPECPFPEDSANQENLPSGDAAPSSPTRSDDKAAQKADFEETRSSMTRIGITDESQVQIFKLLSAVLHLRMLTFEGTDDLQNPCNLHEENPANQRSLETAADLLGVEQEAVMKVITFREITAHSNRRKSIFHRPSTVEECSSRRDSLAKLIYDVLFHWIVDRVGDSVCAPAGKWCSFIGLLDVYGFESFENNSLEQLCINYANEKLQQHFVSSFLREQQDEYLAEGVEWTPCDLTDNVECLLSLEAPRNSLFSLLNEECRLNRPRAGSQLKSRVESTFRKSRYIVQPRISAKAPSFSVIHYAGAVSYRTEDLIEKNKDEIPPEITQLLLSSNNAFVYDIVNEGQIDAQGDANDSTGSVDEKVAPNKGKHRPTVLTRFKKSLDELLETLASTDCHYIRCIKPNKQSLPDDFDPIFVLSQLEACGVVETIRVCSPAHPNKMSYGEFLARYNFLLRKDGELGEIHPEPDMTPSRKKRRCMTTLDLRREACERILKALNNNEEDVAHGHAVGDKNTPLQFGKSMMFMSSQLFESLESTRSEEMVKCAAIVQRVWRAFSLRMKCRKERKTMINRRKDAAALFQRVWRNRVNVRRSREERKKTIEDRRISATRLQRSWLAYKRRSSAKTERKTLIGKRNKAALTIQSGQAEESECEVPARAFRGWRIRYKYKDLIDAWRQLKLIPEDEYRKMIQKRLRLLLGPEVAVSPSPSYEAIKASFEMPPLVTTSPQPSAGKRGPDETDGKREDVSAGEKVPLSPNREKLTVYYDQGSSRKIVVKETVVEGDDDAVASPDPQISQSLDLEEPVEDLFDYEHVSPSPEKPLRSYGNVRHAAIIRSKSLEKVRQASPEAKRSTSLPRLPKGPGVIYAWHNRAVVSMMTSKRPLSLSSDPLTLLELQYNENASVLTTPFASLRSTKRSRRMRRSKHRHSDRHTPSKSSLNQSDFTRISPARFSWSPSPPKGSARSGQVCILKYADVAPRLSRGDGA